MQHLQTSFPYRETLPRPGETVTAGELRSFPDYGTQEKKPKHKRLKKIRSLFLHPFNASGSKSGIPSQRHLDPVMETNGAPPEEAVEVRGKEIRSGSLCGIANHGNTCYMNSVLQCLSNTDRFAEKLIMDSFGGVTPAPSGGALTDQLSLLMALLWNKLDFPQVSLDFYHLVSKLAPQYYGNTQHDSQEFLLWLLDKLYEEMNTVATPKVNNCSFDAARLYYQVL